MSRGLPGTFTGINEGFLHSVATDESQQYSNDRNNQQNVDQATCMVANKPDQPAYDKDNCNDVK